MLGNRHVDYWSIGSWKNWMKSAISNFKSNFSDWCWGFSCKIALRSMSLDATCGKPQLVQVLAWCRQAAKHHPNQCWPSSMSLYGVTRPQWVNILRFVMNISAFVQMTFSYALPCVTCNWPLILGIQLAISQHWFGYCLTPTRLHRIFVRQQH